MSFPLKEIDMNDDIRARIAANDRLLKAVIILLAIKDPHLLDELDAIFKIADGQEGLIGDADKKTRAHLNSELAMIRSLAQVSLDTTH
jgi:hypothetical protein